MNHYYVPNDNGQDFEFTGEVIASASSASEDPNKPKNRWTELVVYKTDSLKYVCHQIGRTDMTNERDRFSAKVCYNEKEIIKFFGMGWLAKEIYNAMSIDISIKV